MPPIALTALRSRVEVRHATVLCCRVGAACETQHMMSRLALEARVILACEAQRRDEAEDNFTEFKRVWPVPTKAARQLAGACNSARGEEVIWIIGDPSGADTSRGLNDPAEWWPAVKACFSEVAPDLALHITVPLPWGGAVAALAFDTSRVPFLVNNPKGGSPEREIPVRDATGTRSARRSEVIAMMAPSLVTARAIVSAGTVTLRETPDGRRQFDGTVSALFVPSSSEPMFFPDTWIRASVSPVGDQWLELRATAADPGSGLGFFIRSGGRPPTPPPHNPYGVNFVPGGISLTGPGLVQFHLFGETGAGQVSLTDELALRLQLRALPSEQPIETRSQLSPEPQAGAEEPSGRKLGTWAMKESSRPGDSPAL